MCARSPFTFAQRLIFYGLSVAVPVLAICGLLIYQYTAQQYRAIEEETLAAAHELARDLEREIQVQLLLLEALIGVLGPEMDLARLHLNAKRALVPHGSHVVVYDVGGWQILNTSVPMGDPLPVNYNPDRIKAIVERDEPYVSDFKAHLIDDQPVWIVSTPIRREDKPTGLIGIARTPTTLVDVLEQRSRPPEWSWYVIDRSDTVVASRDKAVIGKKLPDRFARISEGASGVGWLENTGGTRVVRAYVRSNLSGWLVAVAVPAAVVEAPLREAWMLFGIGSAVLLLLALAVATSVARKLHDNVDVLVGAARKLGRGEPLPERTLDTREFQHIHDALVHAAAEREQGEQRRHLLLRELQHRTNNLLAVIASIARRTLLDGRTMTEARETLLGRLQALANASDTLAAANWQGADMSRVIENEMRAFAGRYTVRGPELLLSAQAAQNMSLVIHELATNASKHGALSHPDGNVAIEWRFEEGHSEPLLTFEWKEWGGPPAKPPRRMGFGYTLLKTVLRDADLKPEIQYGPEGLHYRATVRVCSVLANSGELFESRGASSKPALETLSGAGP
jgi:two-component sensor histidine kinase